MKYHIIIKGNVPKHKYLLIMINTWSELVENSRNHLVVSLYVKVCHSAIFVYSG